MGWIPSYSWLNGPYTKYIQIVSQNGKNNLLKKCILWDVRPIKFLEWTFQYMFFLHLDEFYLVGNDSQDHLEYVQDPVLNSAKSS